MVTHLRSNPGHSFDFLAFILDVETFSGIERPTFVVAFQVTIANIRAVAQGR